MELKLRPCKLGVRPASLRAPATRDLPVGSVLLCYYAIAYRAAMATMKNAQAAVEATVRTWFQNVQSLR